MDPPPRPSTDRFRIRVAVFAPEDAQNLEAVPRHTFVIAKSHSFALQDLPLRELRDVAIRRYKDIYPNESLFQISKSTDAYGSDLFLDDRVGDIFADNEVFRVIQGASIRDSLPPNYLSGRAGSVQPSHRTQRKRSPASPNLGISRAGKRQRVHEPDRPLPSCEQDFPDPDHEIIALPHENVIPNSQPAEIEHGNGFVRLSAVHEQGNARANGQQHDRRRLSPILGEDQEEDQEEEEPRVSTQIQKHQVLDYTVPESGAITPANRSLPISQFVAEDTQERLDEINHNVVDGPDLIKTPPRSSTRVNGTPNRKHGRSDKVSEAEKHEPVAQSRGIRDPYSDIETDLEEPTSIMKRRGGVTRLYGKPPSGTPRWNLRNGNVPVKNRTGTTQKSSSPSAAINPIPRNSLLTAKKANGLVNGTSGASSKLDEDMRDESPDEGAEEAAKELSRLTADAVAQRRLQVEREKIRKDETERKAAEGAKRELKRLNKVEAEKKAADLARQEQERRAAEDERKKAAEIARKEEEEQRAAENERKKAAEIARKEEEKEKAAKIKADAQKAKAAEAKAREEETTRKQAEAIAKRDAEAKEQAERVRKQTAEANERLAADKAEEAAKAAKAAQDKKMAEEASARKKSTPTRSPGGMLGRAVAAYSPDKSTVNHETNGSDMPPPAVHERPGSSRRRSSDIQMTSPSESASVDIGVEGHKLLAKAGRRVSWAEATPSQSGKVPGKIVEARQKASPSVVQTRVSPSVRTPATVNGIRTSKSGSAQGKIQSTIVPVSVRATTVKGKAITHSSSQAPTPTQKTIITPTPGSKESLRAALLGTITKASVPARKSLTPKSPVITISSDEEAGDSDILDEDLELPPLPPPSLPQPQKQQPITPGSVKTIRRPSNASSSRSVSTRQSQRESRSPVNFVNSTVLSQAGSSMRTIDGSRQVQATRQESETSEDSSSESSDSASKASESETPTVKPNGTGTTPSSATSATRRILPPPPRLPHLPSSAATPKASQASRARNEETRTQKQVDEQLSSTTISSSSPARRRAYLDASSSAPVPTPSRASARSRVTPVPASQPRAVNDSDAAERTPRAAARPASMAHLPSLKDRTAEALRKKARTSEDTRKRGESMAKSQHDERAEEEEEEEEEEEDEDEEDEDEDEDSGSEVEKPVKKTTKASFGKLGQRFVFSQQSR